MASAVVVPSALRDAGLKAAGADGDTVMGGAGDAADDPAADAVHERLERAAAGRGARGQRFLIPAQDKSYARQYSHVYVERLKALRPQVVAAFQASSAAKGATPVNVIGKVVEMVAGSSEGLAVGTVYKHQEHKPSVLSEFADEFDGTAAAEAMSNYCSETDTLHLEDESGRIELTNVPPGKIKGLTTGVIIGVQGRMESDGKFYVEELVYPGLAPQRKALAAAVADASSKARKAGSKSKDRYLLLTSGLRVGGKSSDPLKTDLLVEYVTGQLGGRADHALEAEIVRVIVAGGSIAEPAQDGAGGVGGAATKAKSGVGMKKGIHKMTNLVRELDLSLLQISSSVPADVMPGGSDPCNVTLPQQPLHRCLFPQSDRFPSFSRVTNPYECAIDDELVILGSSGQPVSDALKYTQCLQPADVLESMLQWRHMAPTAPDTLACYPFADREPFVIDALPHLFFAGNQPTFGTKLVKDPNCSESACRIVAVPSFADTGLVVLVNLSSPTLECSTIHFDAPK